MDLLYEYNMLIMNFVMFEQVAYKIKRLKTIAECLTFSNLYILIQFSNF